MTDDKPSPAANAGRRQPLRLGVPLVKSRDDIASMRLAGRVVADTLRLVAERARPGITLRDLDEAAHGYIISRGAEPSFLGYQPPFASSGYPATLCLSVNDVILHGIPDGTALAEGNLLSIDCGACMRGFHADAATTIVVGQGDPGGLRLADTTRSALRPPSPPRGRGRGSPT
jgi:methionyl aminopeptidase